MRPQTRILLWQVLGVWVTTGFVAYRWSWLRESLMGLPPLRPGLAGLVDQPFSVVFIWSTWAGFWLITAALALATLLWVGDMLVRKGWGNSDQERSGA
jgi:hypothetical protein